MGQWGRRRPGLRDQKDLLDQSCVCVCHTCSREKQVLFLSLPFQFRAPSLAESHTLPLLQKSVQHLAILVCYGLEFPGYLGKEIKKNVTSDF